jgi:putative membrane-bound dehydrogenase-like protein
MNRTLHLSHRRCSRASFAFASLMLLAASGWSKPFSDEAADLSALPQVPPGYEVKLFAAEPMIRQPCSLVFDAKGRLFVGMGPQYRNPKPETPGDEVVMVLDRDGDGRAEETRVFASGFNTIQGMAWRGDELWIANAPDLTRVRDLNGDDVADEYVKVFTDLGNLEHGLHGLVFAPDGMLYMTKGNSRGLNDASQPDRIAPQPFRELFGQSLRELTTPPQRFTAATYVKTYHDPRDDWGVMGGILRCNADGGGLEIVSRGLRNPWDMAHDDAFNWIATDNDQNDGDRIIMPFYGAHFGWNHPWSSSWTGIDHLPTVPISHPVFHGSGTGVVHGSLGEHSRVFFINDWLNKTTYVFKPKFDGALLECAGGQWQPFIVGATSLYRPTDMEWGPDGALWVLSWSRGYGAEFTGGKMTNEGRIYRIAAHSPNDVGEGFDSPLLVHRIDLQDQLVKRRAVAEVQAMLSAAACSTQAETWCLWTLSRMGAIHHIEVALNQPGNRQLQAIRILGRQGRCEKLLPLMNDGDERVRFEVVQAIWQAGESSLITSLVERAAVETDGLTYYSIWRALGQLAKREHLATMLADPRASVRKAGLLALLESDGLTGDQVQRLAEDQDTEVTEIAKRWLENHRSGVALQPVMQSGPTPAPLTDTPPRLALPKTPTTVEQVVAAMPTADVNRGRLLTLHPQGATCVACHRMEQRGNRFGPELEGIGARAEVTHLIRSILEPSDVITEGFNQHLLQLKSGEAHSGVLLEESGLAVTLGLITGQRLRVPRSEISKHQTLPISAMPPFASMLDAQACADIVAYLAASGKKNADAGKAKPVKKVSALAEGSLVKTHLFTNETLEVDERTTKWVVRYGEQAVAEFVPQHPQIRRPFWMHLRNLQGQLVTRNFPPKPSDPQDHADMHPGLWFALGGVNKEDFWRNEGKVEVQSVTLSKERCELRIASRWITSKGRAALTDVTVVQFSVNGDKLEINWTTTLRSEEQDLIIDGQEEAGLGVRVETGLSVKHGSGNILNAGGGRNEKQIWGKPDKWWRYGTDTAAVTLKPMAPSDRISWPHARDYGLLVLNPTSPPDEAGKPGAFSIRRGEPMTLSFIIEVE